MTRERRVSGLRGRVVAAREHPVRATAHRPDEVSAEVRPHPNLTAGVRDDERSILRTKRQVAELEGLVAPTRHVEAIERLPVDVREALLNVGIRDARLSP